MSDKTTWCYIWFSKALLLYTEYQIILWLKLVYTHKERYRKPSGFIYIFIQLFYIDSILLVRYSDGGHRSDRNMLVNNNNNNNNNNT